MPKGGRPARIFPSRRSTSSTTLVFAVLLMLSVVLLMLLALGILSLPVDKGNDSPKIPNHGIKSQTRDGEDLLGERGSRWTESEEECKHLIELAKPHMEKSTVVDSATGQSKDSRVRTSSGMFLKRGRDKIIRDIEKRIADFTFMPVDHGEGLQVLHYEVGQKYEPHYDYFNDEYNTRMGVNE
ncbi:hypothetical protein QJS10_CPB15g00361 [Acorus calamus]|uniref:Prolyl 4-hydroxylase alpha subunit domain-containing protein n=1 Tax=Acorus calamus TaxID=4465 RepID=A0AAV9D444_ACOCL|nr:hypothetical protein QJS10_CPB15g00361 [Acorus calamus]